jgi:hypothetical protein
MADRLPPRFESLFLGEVPSKRTWPQPDSASGRAQIVVLSIEL